MKREGAECLLVTHLADIRYLCGFTGSNALLCITAGRAALFTDGRYTAQARQETHGARVMIAAQSAQDDACAWLLSCGAKQCFFDPAHTTVSDLARWRRTTQDRSRKNFFTPLESALIADLRMVKDAAEIKIMQAAAKLGVKLFEELLPRIQPGMSESSIAGLLEWNARKQGAEGMSFETIVASGRRSSLPHGRATASRLPRRGFVTLDFGVILRGYCSDMTRTVHLGEPGARQRNLYDAVREAQMAAVAAVKPGVSCAEIDEAARSVLRKRNLAQFFTHSTGHGVGLEIHESPRIAAAQQQVLAPGMVITIEPGAYIPGAFGVRIEDMVEVTRQGSRILTPASTAWTQL